jgi:transposase
MAVLEGANVSVVDWPPKSCDLNPIENMWSIMKRRIDVDIHADVEELEDAVRASWDSTQVC